MREHTLRNHVKQRTRSHSIAFAHARDAVDGSL